MPRNPKGEMNVSEIRNLVRQHNKVSVIKNVDKKSRPDLIKEITDMGYALDHINKKITRGKSSVAQSKTAEPKPQKKTKKKLLIAAGDKPVLATKETLKTKAKTDRKAKIAKFDQMVKKYPKIPANIKGKKIKPARKNIIAGN